MFGNAASWSTSQLTTTEDLSFQSSRYVLLNDNLLDKFRVCLVTQLCLTLCDPMDCSPPGSSAHRILQACPGILHWSGLSFPSPKNLPDPGIERRFPVLAGRLFTMWATKEVLKRPRASLVAQLVKNLPTMQETWIRSLGWEDLLEKGKATHSSILGWRIPWTV